MYSQHNHQHQQADHHNLCDTFHTILQATGTDGKADNDNNDHTHRHQPRILCQTAKSVLHTLCIQCCKVPPQHLKAVQDHPSGDRCIKHH